MGWFEGKTEAGPNASLHGITDHSLKQYRIKKNLSMPANNKYPQNRKKTKLRGRHGGEEPD
jgi:hypothetical protein